MKLGSLEHNQLIIAKAGNSEDVIALLKSLSDRVSDVRKPLKNGDSIEARKVASEILESAIDDIKRLRKTASDNPNFGL